MSKSEPPRPPRPKETARATGPRRRPPALSAVTAPAPARLLSRQERISFRDALIVTCASMARCRRLLTEHLTHGHTIAGVRIENPFRV